MQLHQQSKQSSTLLHQTACKTFQLMPNHQLFITKHLHLQL